MPKAITHERRLKDGGDLLDRFVSEVSGLGHKLSPLLVQLPTSLSFQAGIADQFLSELRGRIKGGIVCEPRHASWSRPRSRPCSMGFGSPASQLSGKHRISRCSRLKSIRRTTGCTGPIRHSAPGCVSRAAG
ncbi:DUF72 domain-containing protein [Microvirga aerophila]|uniref:DUF72 domain-containing protein n=1 Tax=Microvirga aerophila TaxID=670291 RepID=UPI0035A23D95